MGEGVKRFEDSEKTMKNSQVKLKNIYTVFGQYERPTEVNALKFKVIPVSMIVYFSPATYTCMSIGVKKGWG